MSPDQHEAILRQLEDLRIQSRIQTRCLLVLTVCGVIAVFGGRFMEKYLAPNSDVLMTLGGLVLVCFFAAAVVSSRRSRS